MIRRTLRGQLTFLQAYTGAWDSGASIRNALVNDSRAHEADPGVAALMVVPVDDLTAEGVRLIQRVETSGEPGPVLRVLNCASENGLSLDTWGRECVLVTPRSASRNATDFETIAWPRSAWIVS